MIAFTEIGPETFAFESVDHAGPMDRDDLDGADAPNPNIDGAQLDSPPSANDRRNQTPGDRFDDATGESDLPDWIHFWPV